jgi:hypothetical protein
MREISYALLRPVTVTFPAGADRATATATVALCVQDGYDSIHVTRLRLAANASDHLAALETGLHASALVSAGVPKQGATAFGSAAPKADAHGAVHFAIARLSLGAKATPGCGTPAAMHPDAAAVALAVYPNARTNPDAASSGNPDSTLRVEVTATRPAAAARAAQTLQLQVSVTGFHVANEEEDEDAGSEMDASTSSGSDDE